MMNNLDKQKLIKIGRKLQEIRMQKRITQKELAYKLGIEISQITRIERAISNTSIINFINILNALEVSITDFFDDLDL